MASGTRKGRRARGRLERSHSKATFTPMNAMSDDSDETLATVPTFPNGKRAMLIARAKIVDAHGDFRFGRVRAKRAGRSCFRAIDMRIRLVAMSEIRAVFAVAKSAIPPNAPEARRECAAKAVAKGEWLAESFSGLIRATAERPTRT